MYAKFVAKNKDLVVYYGQKFTGNFIHFETFRNALDGIDSDKLTNILAIALLETADYR